MESCVDAQTILLRLVRVRVPISSELCKWVARSHVLCCCRGPGQVPFRASIGEALGNTRLAVSLV